MCRFIVFRRAEWFEPPRCRFGESEIVLPPLGIRVEIEHIHRLLHHMTLVSPVHHSGTTAAELV